MNPKTYAAFEKKTGIKVKKDFYASNEVLQAKLQAGGRGYDLVVPTGYAVAILAGANLLQPIDWSKLPTAKRNLDAKFKNQPVRPAEQVVGAEGLGHDRLHVPHRPSQGEADELEGVLRPDDGQVLREGLAARRLARGESARSRSCSATRTPPATRRSSRRSGSSSSKLKPHIHSIDSIEHKDKLEKGTTVMAQQWNGDGAVVASKKPALYVVAEGGRRVLDRRIRASRKGAGNPDAAHAWIDFVYSPKNNAVETEYTYYGSPLKRSTVEGSAREGGAQRPRRLPGAADGRAPRAEPRDRESDAWFGSASGRSSSPPGVTIAAEETPKRRRGPHARAGAPRYPGWLVAAGRRLVSPLLRRAARDHGGVLVRAPSRASPASRSSGTSTNYRFLWDPLYGGVFVRTLWLSS